MLSKTEAKSIIDKVLSYAKADETSVGLDGSSTGNIRLRAQLRQYQR